MRDFLVGELIAVTLVNETVIRGRLVSWDAYAICLAPDNGDLFMLVHKQYVATVQPLEQ